MNPKRLHPLHVAAAVLVAGLFSATASAAVTYKENLQDCKLPHGEITIPVAGTAHQGQGDLFKFSAGVLEIIPGAGGDKPLDRLQLVDTLRTKNTGDLQFLPDDNGTFWAVSGRIVDAGNRFLYETAALKLDRPAVIPAIDKHPAGYNPGVQEGRTYLVETTDAHYALFRVLDITKTSVLIQYVYQPSGQVAFDLKESDLLELRPGPGDTLATGETYVPAEPPATNPAAPLAAPVGPLGIVGTSGAPGEIVIHVGPESPPAAPTVLEPYLATHLRQRTLLIQTRLKTVRAPATTPAEITQKVDAINDLVELRAGKEAAAALIDQITFVNPSGAGKDFMDSVHPCLAALKKMGIPARDAALNALRRLELTDADTNTADAPLDSPAYRAGLYALVVRGVEGDAVGELILRHERDSTTDPRHRALYEQLLNPQNQQ